MIISTNSWHYKFIRSLRAAYDIEQDICAYTRQIGWVTLNWLLILFTSFMMLCSLADATGWLIAGLVWTFVEIEIIGGIAIGILGIILFLGILGFISWLTTNKLQNNSFEWQAYKAFKNKYCIPLEFK